MKKHMQVNDLRMEHLVGKAEIALMMAKAGRGANTKTHAHDVSILVKLVEAKRNGEVVNAIMDCPVTHFEKLAKYFKAAFPEITQDVMKRIAVDFREVELRKRNIREQAAVTATERKGGHFYRGQWGTNSWDREAEKRRSTFQPFARNDRITLATKKEGAYGDAIATICKRRMAEHQISPEFLVNQCKGRADHDGEMTFYFYIKTSLVNGKLIFHGGKEKDVITDIFTGQQYPA